MPLTEVSPNVRRHASHSQSSRTPKHDLPLTKTASFLAPDAVQSMLRTKTETGDIGQFSVRPSRLPQLGSRMLALRRQSSSFDSSLSPALPHQRSRPLRSTAQIYHGQRQVPSSSTLKRQDTSRSCSTSYRNNPRARQRNGRPYPYRFEGVASPSSGSPDLYSHRSLADRRRRKDFPAMRPNSSMSHPRRLSEEGHRAISPAYSDASPHGYNIETNFYRSASVSIAGRSPVLIFPRPTGVPGYFPHMNNSIGPSAWFPSPGIQLPSYGYRRSPFPSTRNTPVSGSVKETQESPTGSAIPQYYDYTESFAEERYFSSEIDASTNSLPFSMDQTILESGLSSNPRGAQTPFGTMPGSAFHPAELPTKHNRTTSEQSRHSSVAGVSSRSASQQFLHRSKSSKPPDQKGLCVEPHSVTMPAVPKEANPRGCSATSGRTCPSSPYNSFFPNASRSARDLTTLVARVHSPVENDNPQRVLGLESALSRSDRSQRNVDTNVPDWQLPSLNFRPLSLASYAQSNPNRPKSAEGVKKVSTAEIISPTPERPVSSQSRRRFSKILGIEDDERDIGSTTSKPYNSMNFVRMKRVAELPENTYPARFSIPPYSPRRSTITEGTDEGGGDCDGIQDTKSIRVISNAQSAVESLLDKHIHCLGLQPDVSEAHPRTANGQENEAKPFTASETEITVEVPNQNQRHRDEKPRPRSAGSVYPYTVVHPEQEICVSRKPSSNELYSATLWGSLKLSGARSLPCISAAASHSQIVNSSSIGLNTSTSITHPLSPITRSGFEATSGKNTGAHSPDARKHKLKRRSRVTLSLSAYSSRSHKLDCVYDWDIDRFTPKAQWRTDFLARQASERRKVRVRLKLKRSSISHRKLGNNEVSNTETTFYAAPANTDETGPVPMDISRDMKQSVELPVYDTGALTLISSDQESDYQKVTVDGERICGSLDIPHQRSGVVAIGPEVAPPSMDLCCLPSVRTVCSRRSHASLAEPINSRPLSLRIPPINSEGCRLSPPDLPPSLSSLHLDVSVRYPDIVASPRPVLRETRSFFSDDSSAIHKERGSLRNRFHLHSLRSVLPSSPRRTMISDCANRTPRSTLTDAHRSRRHRGDSIEEERDLYGTVGMTDFAYRKRKIIERLKDWWKRHNMQRKFGLKRKKSSKNIANGEVSHGVDDGMI